MTVPTYRLPDWLGGHEVLSLIRNDERTTARVAHPLGGWHDITVDTALLVEVPPPAPTVPDEPGPGVYGLRHPDGREDIVMRHPGETAGLPWRTGDMQWVDWEDLWYDGSKLGGPGVEVVTYWKPGAPSLAERRQQLHAYMERVAELQQQLDRLTAGLRAQAYQPTDDPVGQVLEQLQASDTAAARMQRERDELREKLARPTKSLTDLRPDAIRLELAAGYRDRELIVGHWTKTPDSVVSIGIRIGESVYGIGLSDEDRRKVVAALLVDAPSIVDGRP